MRASPQRSGLPRRSIRLGLTAVYGVLFLVSGAGLLAVTNVLARGWPWAELSVSALSLASSSHVQFSVVAPGPSRAAWQAQLAAEHAAAQNHLLAESGIALGIMAVVSVVLGWLMAGRVLRPLRAMTCAARAISAEDLSRRLDVPGPGDELKDLGDTFDALLNRLEIAFGAQRRFAASASHELRTPLAMMRTSLDVATAKPGPVPPQLTVLAGKLREGLDQGDQLVENLLLLARAQHGVIDDQQIIPLALLIAAAIDARARLIAGLGLRVRHDAADGALVTGNPILLAQMISNVIDNAVRHNYPGGWIRVQVTADGPGVRLLVDNGGPVLDPGKVATLAQPFRRLGNDRTGSAGGTGLGLSIADAIATAHGGELHLHARAGGGLRTVIDLPGTAPAGPAAELATAGAAR